MKTIKYLIAIIIFLICISIIWDSCQTRKDRDRLLSEISQYKISEKKFYTIRKSDSSTISQQSQTILTQSEAIRLGLIKYDGDIKKIQSQVSQIQSIGFKNIDIPFIPNGYADTTKGWYVKFKNGDISKPTIDSFYSNSIIVPKAFSLHKEWVNIDGVVNKNGLDVDSLTIPNESIVTVGWKNKGFLNLSKQAIVEVKNTNPYLSVVKMGNVVIREKKSFLQKPIFWSIVGIMAGYYIKSKF